MISEEYKKLHITEEHLSTYRKMFIQNNNMYNIYSKEHETWYRRNGYISDELILKHFIGEEQLSTFSGCDTDYVLIDIDQGTDLIERYQSLVSELNTPSFIVRSSNSDGLHIYYLLKKRLNTKELISGLKIYLTKKGLRIRNGIYELRPDTGNSIRLPLSSDKIEFIPKVNYLLNSDLSAMKFRDMFQMSYSQSIEYMAGCERYHFSEFLNYKPEPIKLGREVSGKIKCVTFRKEIVEERNRNSAWLIWVQDFTAAGYNRQQIYDAVIERMGSEEWYQGSKDWERNETACRRELIRIININFKRRDEWRANNAQEKFILFEKLNQFEVDKILTGERFDLREQEFMFKLMMLLKSKVKKYEIKVHIASNVFTSITGHKSRRHNFSLIKIAIDKKLIEKVKNPRFGQGVESLAALYKVEAGWFNLDIEGKFSDIVEAIRGKYTEKEIKKLYTRTAASKILQKGVRE